MKKLLSKTDYYELDYKHVWHPWKKNIKLGENNIFVSGNACYVTSIDNKRYLDATSAALNASCGYNHSKIINGITKQMSTLMNFDLSRYSTIPPIELAKEISDLLPEKLTRTFYCTSGSEATEAAVKMAQMYFELTGKKNKKQVISLELGYHGSTIGAISISHSEYVQANNVYLTSVYHSIPAPRCSKCQKFIEHNDCEMPNALLLEDKIRELGADNVAAFIMEPILGIGGYIIPPYDYIQKVSEICKEYNVLFILDETMTSFGRTGKMFAFEHFGVVPDILVCGKGISGGYFPLSTITTSEEIYCSFKNDRYLGGFRHGHTNSGHASGIAAAIATLEVIESENLVDNSRKIGELLLFHLKPLEDTYKFINNIRGLGLMVAIDFKSEQLCYEACMSCFDKGLIVRQANQALALLPPLIICEEEAQKIIKIIKSVLSDMQKKMR
ncbi:aminotransferase class III-fold pyridoxal phosphate-dependent enzyme [Clostridium cibarium]|uniref:Aspartate aminotransferase family protein n=1 Tax=Clostridium cibarium TaxID=2762247 RepID=A0ABR8PY14_9CLOT|nr:aspartate aminotransferase family protein [Clostridium cibarium]